MHQLETLFEFSIEYLVTNLQVKVVLVYKPLIVFIVIHEIWKKNCSCFFQISWIASKNNINWNKVVLPKFFQFLSFFLQQGKSQSWMIWLLNIISVKNFGASVWLCCFLPVPDWNAISTHEISTRLLNVIGKDFGDLLTMVINYFFS